MITISFALSDAPIKVVKILVDGRNRFVRYL